MEKKKSLDNKNKTKCKICGGNVMKGTTYCWFHNPEISEQERNKYRSKGGRKKNTALIPFNQKTEDLKDFKTIKLEKIADVNNFLKGIIMFASNGIIDLKTAKLYSQLCRELIRGLSMEKKNKFLC